MSVWIKKKTFLNIHLSLKVVVCFSTSRWRLLLNKLTSSLPSAYIPSNIKGLNHLFWRQCICWLHAFCLGTICDIGVCSVHLPHVTKKKPQTFLKSQWEKKKSQASWKMLTSAHTFFQSGWRVLTAVSPCSPVFHSWLNHWVFFRVFLLLLLLQPLDSAAESTRLCFAEAEIRQGEGSLFRYRILSWLIA